MLTAEMVVDGRIPSAPAVSPDGRRVAYVAAPFGRTGDVPERELWVVDGTTEPRCVATGDLNGPKWTQDSESLLYLVNRQVHRGGEAVTAWPGGVDGFVPLSDADSFAIIAESGLWLLLHGDVRAVDGFAGRHVAEAALRPDGAALAVLTWASPEIDPGLLTPALHVVDLATGTVRDLGTTPAAAESPVWWRADDGWHVAYLALTPPELHAGTAVFDIGPDGEHRNLTEGMPACPIELVQTDGRPLVLVADGLDTTLRDLDGERARFTGRVEQLSVSRDGQVIAAVVGDPTWPKTVCTGRIGEPLTPCADLRPELRDVTWGKQRRLAYRAEDGLDLDGLLVLPPGKTEDDGPFPLITIVHGGPYDRYADEITLHWAPSGQWLAHAGYAVFLPNARGGQGHGHAFAASIVGALGQAEWTDILTGIDLLVDEGVADPDRLGIAGWSQGGFTAAWAVGQTDRFAAALVGAGITDWGMQAVTGEWGAFEAALSGSFGWEGPGPHPHDRASPISYASSIHTPVLIVHGADDTNVPLSQAEFLRRALRHHGVEHEFLVYPGEGHSLRKRANQLDVLHRTRAWFDRWLR
ncbi:S9 family peptidase [Labedaea rhizosphaerae]|uniref:Dipeptidyl aminopeptidase/acylaminoacyl peptidase n=1 Tax=Labedaea rhizosphaerae TaxID=598644 RepID=A0A4R6S5E5_LABRH|nr:prolyl oligopeptidase family serine peptidase [Labedaea rhizosphaerae]TDP95029.1 dipeptidyl aminopeptidase/acylaminoacyl peptidase [Labedaea rhizosphaerae]